MMANLDAAQTEQMLKDQVAALFQMELEKKNGAIDLARKLRIDQEKLKYRNPADKRAIGFMLDIQYDFHDFHESFKSLLDAEDKLKSVADNVGLVESFLKHCATFGNKVNRKLEKEFELYRVANSSRYGWSAEKFYRQEDLFRNPSSGLQQEEKPWYETDELTPDEKVKKLHRAERQAALTQKSKKQTFSKFDQMQRGRKRTRWGWAPPSETVTSAGASASSVPAASSSLPGSSFAPMQLYHPPSRATTLCFQCHQYGHIKRNCPNVKKEN